MIEKQEAEEFDEGEEDALDGDGTEEEVDLARLTRDMDLARRRGSRQGMPALRKLELLAEQKRIAELTSDFDDYELEDSKPSRSPRMRLGL